LKAQDYISSGLLEAYVLGAISDAESEQVAGAICRFPEVAAEVEALETLLLKSENADGPTLPAGLKEDIWNAIQAAPQSAPIPEIPAERPATIVRPLAASAPRRNWAMAAAWIGLFISMGLNVTQQINQNKTSREIESLTTLNDSLRTGHSALVARIARFQQESDMAARPDMESVPLHSMQPGHPMAATFYLNAGKGEAYVSIHKLPAPPEGMQYQIWAIEDGKPRSIGMLENQVAGDGGMQKVPMPVAGGEAFALSLEKEGGNESPTPGQIYLMGKRPV
jgi:anti-sigma-K factor RskA